MSFSTQIKEELSKISNLANKEAVKFELIGYLLTGNVTILKDKIKFSTESEYNINRFSKLLNNLGYINYKIQIQGKTFTIIVNKLKLSEIKYVDNHIEINSSIVENETIERAIIRGSFLGSGSINNPQNNYHLEIILNSFKNASFMLKLINKYEIGFKILKKKKTYSIYTKDSDAISNFLALIGASKSVLKYENIRVYREIRNNVNRKVNCETANLNKIVNASLKQIEDINYIKEKGRFKQLSDSLREVCELRIENPDASLAELGKMLKNPIGKSGVNHRLKAIGQIAIELGKKE